MSRLIIFLLVVGVLTACGQPGSTTLPTATAPIPTQPLPTAPATTQPVLLGTPIRVDLTPAQRAAMQALVEAINVPVDQIQLISTEAVQWPDGCLGIVRYARCAWAARSTAFASSLQRTANSMNFTPIKMALPSGVWQRAPFVSIAVRAPDNSIQIVDTHVPVDPRPVQITTGLLPQAGERRRRSTRWTSRISRGVRIDQAGTRPLDFVHNPDYGLACGRAISHAWAGPLRPPATAHRLNCSSAPSMARS